MKKAVLSVCAAVCVMGVAAPALAQVAQAVPVTLPWSSSFEDLPLGSSITNDPLAAWVGDADVTAIVTNFDYSALIQAPLVNYPLNTTHSNVVAFKDGGITNLVSDVGQKQVWVDVMLQPIRMEQPAMTAAISNSQMSLFVDTNGLINIFHAVIPDGGDPYTTASNQWTTLSGFSPIGSNEWVRLTVTMDYTNAAGIGKDVFQVQVNGCVFTDNTAYVSFDPMTRTGTWFVCANSGAQTMSQVAFSGSGMFDDLVITSNTVSIQAGVPLILAQVIGTHGSISPSGTVQLASSPGTTNFSINADQFYHIASVTTGTVGNAGAQVTVSQGATVLSVPMTVVADSFINVTFAPDLAAKGTPTWWLNQYGFTNGLWDAAEVLDSDGDGALNWQEYVAGTIPTDSTSVLKVIGQQIAGTTNTIQWINQNAKLGPYVVSSSSNLTTWTTLNGSVMSLGNTNSFKATAPAVPTFYRVSITNY